MIPKNIPFLMNPRLCFVAAFLAIQCVLVAETFEPRNDYGMPLEPKDTVLHGAGQAMAQSFRDYTATVGPELTPVFFMDYAGLNQFWTPEDAAKALKGTRKLLAEHPKLMLQLGLSLTTDGKPEEVYDEAVAAGKFDVPIQNLCDELKRLGCPVLIRIGYECNGSWNGYKPEPYKKAFRRIVEALRKNKVNAAAVWCAYPVDLAQAMPYYPGDNYVDWWSIDLFFPSDLTDKKTTAFLDAAHRHKRPVLIGETTPRTVGVGKGEGSWNEWFGPYFSLINKNPGIKGTSYINWNWSQFPQWSDWGDARLETAPDIAERYRAALSSPLFQHQ